MAMKCYKFRRFTHPQVLRDVLLLREQAVLSFFERTDFTPNQDLPAGK
jgi:hypothetical protein